MEFTRVQKLNVPHRKTNVGQKPYLCWSLNLEQFKQDIKTSTSLNALKHNIKQHYFNELKKKES